MPMNLRLAEMAAFCMKHPLEDKVLVCPNHLTGHQIAESLARNGHPWVNLRVETLSGLAHGLVAEDAAADGLTFASPGLQLSLLEKVIEDFKSQETGGTYFGPLAGMPGFAPAILQAFQDLRLAGLRPSDLKKKGALVSPAKARELADLFGKFQEACRNAKLLSGPDLFENAIHALRKGKPHPFQQSFFLVLEEVQLGALEEQFLLLLAGEKLHLLQRDPVGGFEYPALSTGRRLKAKASVCCAEGAEPSPLSHLFELEKVSAPPARDSLILRRSLSESCEVRSVFRDATTPVMRADQAEALYTEAKAYLPLFVEASEQFGVPCTFEEGVPVRLTQPGRALLGLLEWVESDFEEAVMRRMFSSGALDLSDLEQPEATRAPAPLRAVRHLRAASIGWGRGRYISGLERRLQELESQRLDEDEDDPGAPAEKAADKATDAAAKKAGRLEQSKSEVRCLIAFFRQVFDGIPEGEKVELSRLAQAGSNFVKSFARRSSERDGTAALRLGASLDELSSFAGPVLSLSHATSRLSDLIDNTSVTACGPRPGHLHVASFTHGGYSGRPTLFVVGLDERRFPGTTLQEPILLDKERAALSEHLPQTGERPTHHLVALTACLASHRGNIVLSYPCRDILEEREVFPSSILLQAHRLRTGRWADDFSALDAALGAAQGFLVPPDRILSESEWWLGQVHSTSKSSQSQTLLDTEFPWLVAGRKAEEQRNSPDFTVYDGRLLSAGDRLDYRLNGRPVSPSRLEKLAGCPYAFFLQYVLGIEPKDDLDRDPEVWLNPLQFGSLLHEIFELFMSDLAEKDERPNAGRHLLPLSRLAECIMEAWQKEIPAPNKAAIVRTRRDVFRAIDIFLANETEHCQRSKPRYFEVPFGLPPKAGKRSPALASEQPVPLKIGKHSLLVRGQIDRVDQTGEHEFQVWDYKSGSSWKYSRAWPFDGGRVLQHAIYATVAEALLQEKVDAKAQVKEAGYFFTGPKGEGERISYERSRLAPLPEILEHLMDLLGNGAFVHSRREDACTYCDFQAVCGDPKITCRQAKTKIDSESDDERLSPYRDLNKDE